ncbi:hypothetical protein GCM10027169_09240 [Gordonia jinhuaensis]|uniref:DUF3263 domain-containing protein n=1 Tax=Gordonia jinhuaensis TaxID=1517702 RepID=A0A916TFE2_9ACTN|nr:hypothetical protein [Gordonia jinhuaensis]GGB42905.1 hypothetical protein GCM10011489_33000 [Gordonia jinhuaensis]
MTDPRSTDIIEFASQWYQYGGGPAAEIRNRFGVDERAFFRELDDLLVAYPSGLPAWKIKQIRRVTRHRLWLAA